MEVGNDVELIGIYYVDSYAEKGSSVKAIGWPGLKIGRIVPGRVAPYLVVNDRGTIGWAPPSSIKKITPTPPKPPIIQQTQTQTQEKEIDEDIISVNFVSMGNQDIGHFSVVCKLSWPFSKIEKKLYEDFPQYNKPETFFMVNAIKVEKNKTLKENKIKNNTLISVFGGD